MAERLQDTVRASVFVTIESHFAANVQLTGGIFKQNTRYKLVEPSPYYSYNAAARIEDETRVGIGKERIARHA